MIAENRLVGSAGFFGLPDEHGEVEIGYSVCRTDRRRGIATAAVTALCRLAKARGCASIRARTTTENLASIAVLKRNHFTESAHTAREDETTELVLRRSLLVADRAPQAS